MKIKGRKVGEENREGKIVFSSSLTEINRKSDQKSLHVFLNERATPSKRGQTMKNTFLIS